MNKYTYYKVIQQNWGTGWDDVDHHECRANGTPLDRNAFMYNVKAYKTEQTAPVRVIRRRELNVQAIRARLEELRGEILAERISYGEIAELQSLAQYIDQDDTLLLGWAGVPEDINK